MYFTYLRELIEPVRYILTEKLDRTEKSFWSKFLFPSFQGWETFDWKWQKEIPDWSDSEFFDTPFFSICVRKSFFFSNTSEKKDFKNIGKIFWWVRYVVWFLTQTCSRVRRYIEKDARTFGEMRTDEKGKRWCEWERGTKWERKKRKREK